MKQTIIVLVFVAMCAFGFALPEQLVILDRDAYSAYYNEADLYSITHKLDTEIEIYHYDGRFIIAGVSQGALDKYPHGVIQYQESLPLSEWLYLVTKHPKRAESITASAGKQLFDLGETILLKSSHDAPELRSRVISPFVRFDFSPIKLMPRQDSKQVSSAWRTDIADLVNMVEADSVMWFIQNLQDFQTRYLFAPNRLEVATWIRDQFIRFGISNAHIQPFQIYNTTQYNVVATIPGAVNPDKYIIVGGHHDSIVNTGEPMVFAPGADDNATGTVAALEMARVMMSSNFTPNNSIRFVTFAAEELGLWGSKHYAEDALQAGQEILLMINHDMIGYSTQSPSNWQVRLMPYEGSLEHSQYAAQLTQQDTTLNPTYGSLNSAGSDSHSFWTRGYPAAYFFEQIFCPYYHSDLDIIDYVNGPYAAEVIRASAAIAATYGMMVSAPSNVQVQDSGTGSSLMVRWANSLDPAVDHYRIYYNTSGTNFQNPTLVTPMTGEESWHEITGLQSGTTYYVAVSSVDGEGNESYFVTASGTPYFYPLTPSAFTDSPDIGFVELSWTPNQELDLAGYRLLRSDDASIPGESVTPGLITDNFYLETNQPNPDDYHYYRLFAVDNDGNESQTAAVLRSRPVTLNRGALVMDETLDGNGSNPFQPTGAQVLEFIEYVMSSYAHSIMDLETVNSFKLADIGIYESIFWHGFDQSDFDTLFNHRDAIKRYIELGGKLFVTSYFPTMAIELNGGYPATFDSGRIINNTFGIASADYAQATRFKSAVSLQDGFPTITVDPNKTTASMNGHILKVESISASDEAINIYSYASDYADDSAQGLLNGSPVGVYYDADPGKVVTISFPLYNMDQQTAKVLVEHVFGNLFNAEVSNSDPALAPPAGIAVSPAYPNPFSRTTSFTVDSKSALHPLSVGVYNLKGQLVKTINKGLPPSAKQSYHWDGLDENGNSVATGIYLLKASQNGSSSIRKIMKIR